MPGLPEPRGTEKGERPADQPSAQQGTPHEAAARRHRLARGTRLCLLPVRLIRTTGVDAGQHARAVRVLGGWLREGLRSSPYFDVQTRADGAPVRPADAMRSLSFTVNLKAGQLTTSLRTGTQAPVPLAAASLRDGWPAAVDRLVTATRHALGETVPPRVASVAAIYSGVTAAVDACERGIEALNNGRLREARRLLRAARGHDGGSTYVLSVLATVLQARGDPRSRAECVRLVQEGLRLQPRLSPTTQHRLLRAHALATGDLKRLRMVAATYQRERPNDPHGRFTMALWASLAGEANQALQRLRPLARRWPDNASVNYHLCFALLAARQPDAALDAIRRVSGRLPQHLTVRPTALSLFHANQHKELAQFLEKLAKKPQVRETAALHEVRRMQASHAILQGNPGMAARRLLADLDWLRSRPDRLERFAIPVVEEGTILVRLGHAKELEKAIRGFHDLDKLPQTFQNALTYLDGLCVLARNGKSDKQIQALRRDGEAIWSALLQAATAQKAGALQEEARALERAIGGTSDPIAFADYVRVLRVAGEKGRALKMRQELKKRLLLLHPSKLFDHPLMSPSRALAWKMIE